MGKKEKLGNKINKFKRILNFFKITSLLMTLVYFIYALVTERGNNIINIVLTVIYFIYMVITIIGIIKNNKSVKKVAKKGYKWAKMLIKLFTLASTLYGIYTATTDVTFMSVLLAVFMAGFYLMKLFFSLMVEIISHQVKKVVGIFKNKNKEEVEVK